jgi:hypothetical protein
MNVLRMHAVAANGHDVELLRQVRGKRSLGGVCKWPQTRPNHQREGVQFRQRGLSKNLRYFLGRALMEREHKLELAYMSWKRCVSLQVYE